ncbi:MAG: DNA topoisomerase I [Candidatus Micrarchaeia archaeon]
MAETLVIIAEKPKVAEKIARFLDDKARKKSEHKIPYYELERDGKKIYVVSAVGHLFSLKEKGGNRRVPEFDIGWVPAYEASKASAHTKDYITTIEKVAKKADVIVSACDYDVEGSLIGFNAIRFSAKRTSGKRMKFSALTKEDIVSAYENMGELDYNNAYAGEARHFLDWYWGINLSRLLMDAIRKAGAYKVLSIGRVQGPTLDILVKREREIAGFKPVPYWEVAVEKDKIKYLHEKEKFWDEKEADAVLSATSKEGIVEEVTKKMFKVAPPAPFDLTSLQVEAYRAYKMSPKEVLQYSQNLYENSYISYPRTSSQKLPLSLNLKGILEKMSKIDEYRKDAQFLLEEGMLKPHEGEKSDAAHPAIHPTGIYGKMSEQEKKLYDLIARRFIACFGEWAVKESTTVRLKMGNERYKGQGIVIKKPGWIGLYGKYYTADEERLPELNKGQKFVADKITKDRKETKPPARYTATSLVKVLEKKNLGTKATRATIIDTLFKRDYVREKSMRVTSLGMAVHDALMKYSPEILDEHLTEQFEDKVEKIQEGKEKEEKVLAEARDVLSKIIDEFKKNEYSIGKELLSALRQSERSKGFLMKCEQCGKEITIKTTKDKRIFIGCTGWPNCKVAYPIPFGVHKVSFVKKCEECGAPVIKYIINKRVVVRCANPKCPLLSQQEGRDTHKK